ncbi:MAG TPA: chemotaxis protein CheA, partial [Bacillales bacterium]|nr:chemotaxis protein CheA [Bacillales bacterium]
MEQYLEVFVDESREHLQTMNDGLLVLEKQKDDSSAVQEIFRAAHTLKGMSATMGYEQMAELTHQMENVLDAVRKGQLSTGKNIVDVLLRAADGLEMMVEDIAEGGKGTCGIDEIIVDLQQITGNGETPDAFPAQSADIRDLNEHEQTVVAQSRRLGFHPYRIRVVLREDCLLKAARAFMVFEVLEGCGEIIRSVPDAEKLQEEKFDREFSVVLATKEEPETLQSRILKVSEIEAAEIEEFRDSEEHAPQRPATDSGGELRETKTARPSAGRTIRINIERLDRLMNLFEEFVIDKGRLEKISLETADSELSETVERISRITGDMQEMILTLRMVPINQVFRRFPKMVRSLAKELNKDVNLNISGGDTELDRTVIDEIGDPLVHLLRNSIDHGIEPPEIRRTKGKPAEGTVDLKAYYSGNHVFIEIMDDGAGIDRYAVMNRAIANGVLTGEEAERMGDQNVYDLLFSPGFSTADKVSDVSGRGVGLDVVKNKIESLGGRVDVTSVPGEGTGFTIQLPLTLSILAAMLVEVGKEVYAIPLSSIEEIAELDGREMFEAHGQRMMD